MKTANGEGPPSGRTFATQAIAEGRRIATPEGIERMGHFEVGAGRPRRISIRGRHRVNLALRVGWHRSQGTSCLRRCGTSCRAPGVRRASRNGRDDALRYMQPHPPGLGCPRASR